MPESAASAASVAIGTRETRCFDAIRGGAAAARRFCAAPCSSATTDVMSGVEGRWRRSASTDDKNIFFNKKDSCSSSAETARAASVRAFYRKMRSAYASGRRAAALQTRWRGAPMRERMRKRRQRMQQVMPRRLALYAAAARYVR